MKALRLPQPLFFNLTYLLLLAASIIFFLSPWATVYVERGAYTYTGVDFSGFSSKPLLYPSGLLCLIGFLLAIPSFFSSRLRPLNSLAGEIITLGCAFSFLNYSLMSIGAAKAELHFGIFMELITAAMLTLTNALELILTRHA